jgi:site-specific recombinase
MKEIIEEIISTSNFTPQLFSRLFDKIRPSDPSNSDYAFKKLALLSGLLNADKELKTAFNKKLIAMIGESKQSALLTQTNLLSRGGLFSELRKRTFYKVLPNIYDEKELSGIVNTIFYKKTDWIWISDIPTDKLANFLIDLGVIPSSDLPIDHYIVQEILNDIYVLSQVITSLSIDRNIVKNFESVLTIESPFMQLHERIGEYTAGIKNKEITRETEHPKYKEVIDAINACTLFVNTIRQSNSLYGTSIELALVLQKLNKSLERMHELLHLLVKEEQMNYFFHLVHFIKKIIKLENQKNSIRKFFNDTISLLAYEMTEHSGKTGEHYVTSTVKEYFQMFYDALKGGLAVGFMVVIKYLINALHLPIFQDTLLKALNYSLGFVGIQLLHGTVATKQPSMTAATIAQSIESHVESEEIIELGEFVIKVFRSQFIAVAGNLLLAFPIAFGISWGWYELTGAPIASPEEALHKVEGLNPFTSLCVLHAAIAGVMLFLAGILSGIADNANIYNKYPQRIKLHRGLIRIIGQKRAIRLGDYIENNLGTLTGSFSLGFLLAFVAFIGFIFGLPLDIQHVSFATGNAGFALATFLSQGYVPGYALLMASLGIIVIGIVNITVSFSLALIVAIRAREIKLTRTGSLVVYLIKQFFTRPMAFFMPMKEKKVVKAESEVVVRK